MARKKRPLILRKLGTESAVKLESMVGDLTGEKASGTGPDPARAKWNRRFAASGKMAPAPKIRLS